MPLYWKAEYRKLGLVGDGRPYGALGEARVACAGHALLGNGLLVAKLLVCIDGDLAGAVGLCFNELLDFQHLCMLKGILGVNMADDQFVLAGLIRVAGAVIVASSAARAQSEDHG